MNALDIVLTILDVIFGISLVVLFAVQEGNDRGLGVISGGSSETDTFFSKSKGRSLEERLKRYSLYAAIAFSVTSVVLYLAIARGW